VKQSLRISEFSFREVKRVSEKRTGLRLTEQGDGLIKKILTDYDGMVIVDELVSPHDELIRFMDRKINDYNKRLKALEEHPLFKESLDVSETDLFDLIDCRCKRRQSDAVSRRFREYYRAVRQR
jgi:hypothetical protein